MKNRAGLINKFIEERAKAETFDEIVKKIGVSKPTLIRWSRDYQEEINEVRKELAKEAAREIVKRNIDLIRVLVNYSEQRGKNAEGDIDANGGGLNRLSKRIFELFGKELKRMRLEIAKKGKNDIIKIEFES